MNCIITTTTSGFLADCNNSNYDILLCIIAALILFSVLKKELYSAIRVAKTFVGNNIQRSRSTYENIDIEMV